MSTQYDAYLPHMNATEGMRRVRNNTKLYKMLLAKFKGRQMADEIAAAIAEGDSQKIVQVAHALRGTAANLGFPIINDITEQIETTAKAQQSPQHLVPDLYSAMDDLLAAIEQFCTQVP